MYRNKLNDHRNISRNVKKYPYYICSNGGHQAAVIQADYHVMTNWDATRNSHKCEYYPFRQTQKQTNKKIISFIEQTNTQNIDVNIIHFCKKQTPKNTKDYKIGRTQETVVIVNISQILIVLCFLIEF